MKKSLFVAAALCFTASAALADTNGVYTTAEGGFNFLPNLRLSSGGTVSTETFSTGPSVGGAAGYNFGNGFRTEIDGLYSHADLERLGGVTTSGHLNATSLMLDGLYGMDVGALKPYVGVGAGFTQVSDNIEGAGGSQWVPGYQLRAGAGYDLSSDLTANLEYRWQQSETARFTLAGVSTKQEFEGNGLLLGLTYHMQ